MRRIDLLKFISVLALVFSSTALAQSVFYAGHAGQGGGEANPGAISNINLSTGEVSLLGVANTTGGGVAGLASSEDTIYAALAVNGAAQLVTINPSTGMVATVIGDVTLDGGGVCAIGDLAMGGDGVLYGMTANGNAHVCDGFSGGLLVIIDTSTAVATAIGRPFDTRNIQGGLAVDGGGNLWLSPGWNNPTPGFFHILDKTNGQIQSSLALSGEFPTGSGANGFVWNPDNGMLYASFEQLAPGNTSLWEIDPESGVSTLITDSTAQLHDIVAWSGSTTRAVPINSAWLIGLLVFLLGAVGLRRFNAHG